MSEHAVAPQPPVVLANSVEQLQELFDNSPRMDPQLAATIYTLGYAHLLEKRYELAMRSFSALFGSNPKDRRYLAGLALSMAGQGYYVAALEINAVALYWYPHDVAVMLRQAECLLALRRPTEALEWLDAVIAGGAPEGAPTDTHNPAAGRAAGLRALLLSMREEKESC